MSIVVESKGESAMELPPGFRFHPTDEEIISHYLIEKVINSSFSASAIGEVDLNKCEPWDLPKRAKMGDKEWYFFCQRDRKYPTGMRTNRATESGYWKATGKDKEIYKGKGNLVGMKKTLVFYKGRAPKGDKSNWVMHEYRLEGKFSYYNLSKPPKDEWVVSRVFHKSSGIKKLAIPGMLRMSEDHLIVMETDSDQDPILAKSSLPTTNYNYNYNYKYHPPCDHPGMYSNNQIPLSTINPLVSFPSSNGILRALAGCKVEVSRSQSQSQSQDTTDMNNISSLVSNQQDNNMGIADLHALWDY